MQTVLSSEQMTDSYSLFQSVRRVLADLIFPEGRDQRDRAEREANVDVLTGLASRRAFDRARATAESDRGTAVLVFDANNFGRINKVAGFLAGDACIQELASCVQAVAEIYKLENRCFRIGGDEFVVLVPFALAETVRDQVEASFGSKHIGDIVVSVSGTIGNTFAEADSTLQARKLAAKSGIA